MFLDLKEKERMLRLDLCGIANQLQIMRSMPDLTVSPAVLQAYVENVIATQPKLDLQKKMDKSMLEMLPLRDWKTGVPLKITPTAYLNRKS